MLSTGDTVSRSVIAADGNGNPIYGKASSTSLTTRLRVGCPGLADIGSARCPSPYRELEGRLPVASRQLFNGKLPHVTIARPVGCSLHGRDKYQPAEVGETSGKRQRPSRPPLDPGTSLLSANPAAQGVSWLSDSGVWTEA